MTLLTESRPGPRPHRPPHNLPHSPVCRPAITPRQANRASGAVRPARSRWMVNGVGIIGIAISALVLTLQMRSADLGAISGHVRVDQLLIAVGLMGLSLIAAAYNLVGFSPLKLRLVPTVGAQLAVSGLRVIAPSAVSTPAIASRYLKCAGASSADAVATVAVAQSAQLLVTTALVAGLGVWSGAGTAGIAEPRTALIVLGAVAVLGLAGWLTTRWSARCRTGIAAVRRSAAALARHARNRPGMVAAGLAGATALTATHVLAFAFCVSAVGGHASYLSLTLIYLAAASAGSLIPTPGGVGAVEAALIAGLTATGMALPIAAAASLLSRLISVWLLAIPGWIALAAMRRRGLL
jgi:glycosyltransferase 2 family protein